MKVNTLKLKASDFPEPLLHIDQPPKQLFIAGVPLSEWINRPKVAIVGSRKATPYGLAVTKDLSENLSRAGVVIISGLALGIDAAAHKAALFAGGTTVAVLPTPLSQIYPASHLNLARQIIEQEGSVISEYNPTDPVYQSNFRDRNRLISALADIVLVTEAALKSGSLITARFGLEQGRTIMAVPGNINSPTSEGCNNLIKSGALPVTGTDDIFFALGLTPKKRRKPIFRGNEQEEKIYTLIINGINNQEELALEANLNGAETVSVLTTLELSGHIKPAGAGYWVAL